VWPDAADRAAVQRTAEAIYLVRDLINLPANDLGPAELADAAEKLARRHKAKCRVIVGDELIEAGYPAIHAVGRASVRAPRLIDLTWGRKSHSKVTIVGKGVCFDSGGLDIKPSSGMLLMKKDMGGAAHALGLAHMIMAAGLPVRLRVLVPAVENMVSGDAFRPLDVLRTRKGLTVEVGNTDAEGRLILCDALAEACREKPALLVDFSTLTGAARVALGPDIPAMFSNDDALADDLAAAGRAVSDPVWRLPLHQPYRKGLDSKVADIGNVASGGFAGAIVAGLFLEAFVEPGIPWAHFDLSAWNFSARPGRPEGGEALALRAVHAVIARRFGGGE
jgi:leucyl aminopeptidase